MRRRGLVLIVAALLAALPAAAQFYSQGSEPVGTRWWQIKTADYRVIYPEGLDSLARIYADQLERVKIPVGATAGYIPNQEYRNRMPVILHPGTAHANGMVAWTPRRMELFTTPTYNAPEATPWHEHLIIHESRHVSQMQFTNAKPYRPYGIIMGQLFSGAATVLYGGQAFDEGDAVAAETELTRAGRGRSASFLEYYRSAFREGDTRNFWQWRYGSLVKNTPDYYTIGYIRAAGMRSVFGVQDFTARFYDRIFSTRGWPWPLFNYPKTVKETTGKKFPVAFAEITDTLRQRWSRDEQARAPFMPFRQLTPTDRRYTEFRDVDFMGEHLYAVRSGLDKTTQLVEINRDGKSRVLSQFSYSNGRIHHSEALGRLYWTEITADPRWELRSYSEIWYSGADGRHHRLSRRTRWFNLSLSPDGLRLSTTEYPIEGGSALLTIDARTGEVLSRYQAPDGLQVVESAWLGERLMVTGIDCDGSGIFEATDGFRKLFDCGNTTISELAEYGGDLYFVSDLSGVNELYRLREGKASRLTSSVQGATDYVFTPAGDTLLYVTPGVDGKYICATAASELPEPVEADFSIPHRYEFAEDLEAPVPIDKDSTIVISEPKRYSRLLHLFRFHSWAPLYVSTDAVSDLSFESIASSAGLGATAFFQNELETLTGSVAYGAFYDEEDGWTHLAETKFTYSGLLPKIEASLSIENNPASFYYLQSGYSKFEPYFSIVRRDLSVPSFNASVKMYLPLNFSSGGIYRGLIPQVEASGGNSMLMYGAAVPMNRVSASLRGYVMTATPEAAIYPRLGFGLEAGWCGRVGSTGVFSPNAYLFGYGYLPGFMSTHGIKLTATTQKPLGEAFFTERYASVLPRGMSDYSSLAYAVADYSLQNRLTLDYVFPFLPLDWSALCPVAYVRNLECTLHADGSYFLGDKENLALASVGADLCVVLGNLAWVPYTTRIGVSAYWNWGAPAEFNPYTIGLVFNIDM